MHGSPRFFAARPQVSTATSPTSCAEVNATIAGIKPDAIGGSRWSHRFASGRGLFVFVRLLLGVASREAGFGNWSRRSLETFPKDLVVEFRWNTVFSREVEAA